ncbi:MAG: glycosyltransferase [Candidatus Omnitrophica bacterium]|nr:glycosyltransferase [Candidatus Omnitrophota bacterium]
MKEISLVIPLKNEEKSIRGLIDSICAQTVLPDEVIFVDGGSSDGTKSIIRKNIDKFLVEMRLIEMKKAYPGEARNAGVAESMHDFIAFTDGGILLDKKWLEELTRPMAKDNAIDVVYGAYEPILDSFIKECSLMGYIPPREKIRGLAFRTNFIASSIFKKCICDNIKGFPSFRAAEDKIFMDKVEKSGAKISYTDKAIVYWQIPGSLKGIFKRFSEFSAHDILAGRARDWHHSVFRTYAALIFFFSMGILLNPLFLWGILAVWVLRLGHMFIKKTKDFKVKFLLDPRYFFGIAFVVLATDMALFCGSLKYLRMYYEKNK